MPFEMEDQYSPVLTHGVLEILEVQKGRLTAGSWGAFGGSWRAVGFWSRIRFVEFVSRLVHVSGCHGAM